MRDEAVKITINAAHAANHGVFGARKIWLTLNREREVGAPPIAWCTVERLMGELGLAGARRGWVERTTVGDPRPAKPHDLVNRNVRPVAPDRLWVADLTSGLDLVELVLHRVRHRRLRPANPGLVGGNHDDQRTCCRRGRPGGLDPTPRGL